MYDTIIETQPTSPNKRKPFPSHSLQPTKKKSSSSNPTLIIESIQNFLSFPPPSLPSPPFPPPPKPFFSAVSVLPIWARLSSLNQYHTHPCSLYTKSEDLPHRTTSNPSCSQLPTCFLIKPSPAVFPSNLHSCKAAKLGPADGQLSHWFSSSSASASGPLSHQFSKAGCRPIDPVPL